MKAQHTYTVGLRSATLERKRKRENVVELESLMLRWLTLRKTRTTLSLLCRSSFGMCMECL